MLLGFLRAHGRLRSTALVCALALVINAVNLAAAVASRADTYAPGRP